MMDWVGLSTNACTAFLKASGIEGGASPRVLVVSSVDKLDKLIGCLQQDSFDSAGEEFRASFSLVVYD